MTTSRFSTLIIALLGTLQTNAQTLQLDDGTPVRLRLMRNVSSGDAKLGESVDFELLDDIKVGALLVAPKGSLAIATVTEVEPKKRMGRAGKLDINIDYFKLSSGEKATLRAVKEFKGGSNAGKMTGAIVATSIIFFPAAPLFLFIKGKDISIPKGTEITAYVNGNVTIDLAKLNKFVRGGVKSAVGRFDFGEDDLV